MFIYYIMNLQNLKVNVYLLKVDGNPVNIISKVIKIHEINIILNSTDMFSLYMCPCEVLIYSVIFIFIQMP